MIAATQPSILPALVAQLMTAAPLRGAEITEARRINQEAILIALLDHGNLTRSALAKQINRKYDPIRAGAAQLIEQRLVYSWRIGNGCAKARWYGLTPEGAERAKALKEMGQ